MKTRLYYKCNGSSNEIVWFNFHCTQSEEATPIDQFLVCGEHYKTIRNAVAKGVMEGKVDGLEETCEVMLHHFLAATQHQVSTLLLCACLHGYLVLFLYRGADAHHSGQQFIFC